MWKIQEEYEPLSVLPGDTIVFTRDSGDDSAVHNVILLPDKKVWTECIFDNGAEDLGIVAVFEGDVSYKIPITGKSGEAIFFSCSIGEHCSLGQKLRVNVGFWVA